MIASFIDGFRGLKSFRRGIHPPHRKEYAQSEPIRLLRPKSDLHIPLTQHIGAPCAPTVKPKSRVQFGDKIADTDSFVSAPIHATGSGTIVAERMVLLPTGRRVAAIPLRLATEGAAWPENLLQDFLRRDWDGVEPDRYDADEICQAIRDAGIVGLGGATFPTHVKLKKNPDRPVDTLVLNGCECEPYLTADHRLMLEAPEAIVVGLQLAARAAGVSRAIIAIESNKPDAVETMRKASAGRPDIEVMVCASKYPMGGERQLVPAVLNRVVPSAPKGLPLDVGVVVVNVTTAHSIARGVVHKQPLTHRVVTVTGKGVARPGNWLTPIGTSFSELIEHCGGVTNRAVKVLAGGPMMGPTLPHLNVPVIKATGGITIMEPEETAQWEEGPCIRCGRCIDNCPLYLSPTKIAHAIRAREYELAYAYDMLACCECGCCSYVCPARIPLAQYVRAGKNQWSSVAARKKEKE
ncbi:MAG: electron transport complex subunit RsxC [Phycisphaerales bacterium]|nr:MAG: electron transport complex subunit RsxC [Phycisphaerales bacterium]